MPRLWLFEPEFLHRLSDCSDNSVKISRRDMPEIMKNHPGARPRRAFPWSMQILWLPLVSMLALWGQTAKQPKPAKTPVQQSSQTGSQTSANPLPPVQLDGSAALHHLNQIISWYRHSTTGIQ
ncbi:MAG: hypothetical protein WA881_13795, partial [Candidatus Sulfotelmatobacter sp.]